jgi:hypothetical protein
MQQTLTMAEVGAFVKISLIKARSKSFLYKINVQNSCGSCHTSPHFKRIDGTYERKYADQQIPLKNAWGSIVDLDPPSRETVDLGPSRETVDLDPSRETVDLDPPPEKQSI